MTSTICDLSSFARHLTAASRAGSASASPASAESLISLHSAALVAAAAEDVSASSLITSAYDMGDGGGRLVAMAKVAAARMVMATRAVSAKVVARRVVTGKAAAVTRVAAVGLCRE